MNHQLQNLNKSSNISNMESVFELGLCHNLELQNFPRLSNRTELNIGSQNPTYFSILIFCSIEHPYLKKHRKSSDSVRYSRKIPDFHSY